MYTPELLDEARKFMHHMLTKVVEYGGSDLFITADFPPSIKQQGLMKPFGQQKLAADKTRLFAYALMNERQIKEFESVMECNFGISVPGVSRFRVNVFQQQHNVGMVIRTITTEIPSFQQLGLPNSLQQVIMEKRGLVLIVGATGVGKSTTLAAMMGYRNENSRGHIITIEDPIEYLHEHKGCIITQREVGIDTKSFEAGLKNALRQAPDVILIGEIRTRETMDYAIQYAETGHLVFATLHATNANQALERIIHFFEAKHHEQILMDLSLNLRAIVAQQLIATPDGKGRRPAIEILLNSQLIGDYIRKGEIHEIKPVMKRSREIGMQTFDQALFDLYENGDITYRDAIQHADSPNDLRLLIKLESKSANKTEESELELSLQSDDNSAANDNAIS